MKQILPDVYWLDGGGNFYLCVEEDGLTLVDTGMPKKQEMVWQGVASLDRQPVDIARILITHADIDHVGSLAALQEKSGATVYAGEQTAAFLRKGKPPKHLPWLAHVIVSYFMGYKPVTADVLVTISDGQELPVLGGCLALATPGHTLDHFSFFCPRQGLLFAGDALHTRNGRLQCTPPRITADTEAARRSAIRLLELAPAVIACGHGAPIQDHTSDDLMALFNELRRDL